MVSIPLGTINTQKRLEKISLRIMVSIPLGTINTINELLTSKIQKLVSIPLGTINTCCCRAISTGLDLFQFH